MEGLGRDPEGWGRGVYCFRPAASPCFARLIKEFPKMRGTLFWGPYNKDPTISGAKLGSPILGNYHKTIKP